MKKVTLVLGLGVSGRAAAEFLLAQGEAVIGIDASLGIETRALEALGLLVQQESSPIDWNRVDKLVVSPGIPQSHPLYVRAKVEGIPIIGEVQLALPSLQKPLLAVTGTNGKTTVTLLAAHILNSSGIKAKALGNIGTPLCQYVMQPEQMDVFVIELSSYQLETLHTPVFDAAVLLNITPDHLDRYSGMHAYAAAKCHLQNLVRAAGAFFVQAQAADQFGALLMGREYQRFGMQKGLDLWSDKSQIVYREKMECLLPLHYREMGGHDCENVLAAWALCRPFGLLPEQFCEALSTFQKPPHRIAFVREVAGVSYFDDSKGTNIDAVVQAVGTMKGDVVLIVGGVDKGASYLPWKDHFLGKVKKMIAIGEAAPKIYRELHPYFSIQLAGCLEEAVQIARADAKRGDCVLLSPGCSSYDMFCDYAHRGEAYQRAVQTL